jgi:hypothetical protein
MLRTGQAGLRLGRGWGGEERSKPAPLKTKGAAPAEKDPTFALQDRANMGHPRVWGTRCGVRRGILRLRPDLSAQRGQREEECRDSAPAFAEASAGKQNDSISIPSRFDQRRLRSLMSRY